MLSGGALDQFRWYREGLFGGAHVFPCVSVILQMQSVEQVELVYPEACVIHVLTSCDTVTDKAVLVSKYCLLSLLGASLCEPHISELVLNPFSCTCQKFLFSPRTH